MRIASAGHAVFAAVMIALGVLTFAKGNFAPVWDPVPEGVPGREILVYVSATVSLASGIGLLFRGTAGLASRVLLACLALWLLCFRAPGAIHAPAVVGSWFGCAETSVMVAGAWVLYAWFASGWDRRVLGFATGAKAVRCAGILYGLALILFGLAHFVYLNMTTPLVPHWLPAPTAWAYFTGGAFLAAGAAILIGVCARLAAALSAVQLGLFTLLVWVPIVAAGSKDPFQWSETILSFALTAGAWVVADSFRGTPWIGRLAGAPPAPQGP
jgi:uncharacterized membrane protein